MSRRSDLKITRTSALHSHVGSSLNDDCDSDIVDGCDDDDDDDDVSNESDDSHNSSSDTKEYNYLRNRTHPNRILNRT